MEFNVDTMHKLAELLRTPEPDVLQGSDLPASGYEIVSSREDVKASKEKVPKAPKTIEEYEDQLGKEAEELGRCGAGAGDRKTPEYSMNYQQAVTAEDVFLQIGPKTTSSASCENLIVRIKLPGDKKENVDLNVDSTSVTLDSPQHHLKLSLPHAINPDASKANWDTAAQTLILTLKLDREFDFINF